MDYTVKIENFEGPLDLLLYFIQRDKINIYDISINHITKEYLDFVNLMQHLNIEIAGEFILMASMLIKIKSKMLLPSHEKNDEENIDDPRKELFDRLIEYKKIKYATEEMKEILDISSMKHSKGMIEALDDDKVDFSEYYKQYSIIDLVVMFNGIINKSSKVDLYETEIEQFTINDKSNDIMQLIKDKGNVIFSDFINSLKTRLEIIVCFLAMLELLKQQQIKIVQKDAFSHIEILKNE